MFSLLTCDSVPCKQQKAAPQHVAVLIEFERLERIDGHAVYVVALSGVKVVAAFEEYTSPSCFHYKRLGSECYYTKV